MKQTPTQQVQDAFDPIENPPQKEPEQWSTGDEQMTSSQASYLKTLCAEAGEEFDTGLTKAEASRRINELQERTGRGRTH